MRGAGTARGAETVTSPNIAARMSALVERIVVGDGVDLVRTGAPRGVAVGPGAGPVAAGGDPAGAAPRGERAALQ